MKKLFLLAACAAGLLHTAQAQRTCGAQQLYQSLSQRDPQFAEHMKARTEAMHRGAVLAAQSRQAGTQAAKTIPIVFHVILNQTQLNQIGGAAGVAQRADSQVAVITRDFNRQNGDSTKIPAAFKPVYGDGNLRFGLAHTDPQGRSTPGYEIKVTNTSSTDFNSAYSRVKHAASDGLDAWNTGTYLNVWVIYPSDQTDLLGVTIPPAYAAYYSASEIGVVLNYGAFGVKTGSGSGQYYVSGITLGRTLTHELGHYFELVHTWGDDNGACPGSGGTDDNISDTPPEANALYGNPTYPKYDACSSSGSGVMFMNYMDYVDDISMYMFTLGQCSVISFNTNGESVSLTTHPTVLGYPGTSVVGTELEAACQLFPNPGYDAVHLVYPDTHRLQSVTVQDLSGRNVLQVSVPSQTSGRYDLDVSSFPRGVYFLQCRFEGQTISKKLLLQ